MTLNHLVCSQDLLAHVSAHMRARAYQIDTALSAALDDLARSEDCGTSMRALADDLRRAHDWILTGFQRPPFFDRAADPYGWELRMNQIAADHHLVFEALSADLLTALKAARPEPLSGAESAARRAGSVADDRHGAT